MFMTAITSVISFFTGNKKMLSVLLIVAALAGGIFWFNSYKDNLHQHGYDEGYNKAVQEYTQEFLRVSEENQRKTEAKLRELRLELQKQHAQELTRVKEEAEVDKKVDTATEYIEKKVYVKEECNTVDPSLIRMFNESIYRVNSSYRDK